MSKYWDLAKSMYGQGVGRQLFGADASTGAGGLSPFGFFNEKYQMIAPAVESPFAAAKHSGFLDAPMGDASTLASEALTAAKTTPMLSSSYDLLGTSAAIGSMRPMDFSSFLASPAGPTATVGTDLTAQFAQNSSVLNPGFDPSVFGQTRLEAGVREGTVIDPAANNQGSWSFGQAYGPGGEFFSGKFGGLASAGVGFAASSLGGRGGPSTGGTLTTIGTAIAPGLGTIIGGVADLLGSSLMSSSAERKAKREAKKFWAQAEEYLQQRETEDIAKAGTVRAKLGASGVSMRKGTAKIYQDEYEDRLTKEREAERKELWGQYRAIKKSGGRGGLF